MPGINPSKELANAEFNIELSQVALTEKENLMDQYIGLGSDNPSASAQVAQIKAEINTIRAKIGFWRGQSSEWKQSINENKLANKENNKLATTA